ncbi:MAG: hypothetical protein HY735_29720 [Verrucomicrobia bacterium]|nr:hypothetical protein [Verrucomicrobiota bacterium]
MAETQSNPGTTPDVKPQSSDSTQGECPGGTCVNLAGIVAIGIYLAALAYVLVYGLVKFWPSAAPSRSSAPTSSIATGAALSNAPPASPPGTAAASPGQVQPVGAPFEVVQVWRRQVQVRPESRLFLVVAIAGALGGLLHSVRSFYWYVGNRNLKWSWVPQYVLLPWVGAILGLVIYLILRGGLLAGEATVSDTNPFGFAAFASMAGLFSEQAVEKLRQLFEGLLARSPKGRDHVQAEQP